MQPDYTQQLAPIWGTEARNDDNATWGLMKR